MNINPDYLIERKRNKSQILRWKILSLLIVLMVLVISISTILKKNDLPFFLSNIKSD